MKEEQENIPGEALDDRTMCLVKEVVLTYAIFVLNIEGSKKSRVSSRRAGHLRDTGKSETPISSPTFPLCSEPTAFCFLSYSLLATGHKLNCPAKAILLLESWPKTSKPQRPLTFLLLLSGVNYVTPANGKHDYKNSLP